MHTDFGEMLQLAQIEEASSHAADLLLYHACPLSYEDYSDAVSHQRSSRGSFAAEAEVVHCLRDDGDVRCGAADDLASAASAACLLRTLFADSVVDEAALVDTVNATWGATHIIWRTVSRQRR